MTFLHKNNLNFKFIIFLQKEHLKNPFLPFSAVPEIPDTTTTPGPTVPFPCDSVIDLENLGGSVDLQSPNYPDLYPNNQDCTWVVEGVAGQTITAAVSEWNVSLFIIFF